MLVAILIYFFIEKFQIMPKTRKSELIAYVRHPALRPSHNIALFPPFISLIINSVFHTSRSGAGMSKTERNLTVTDRQHLYHRQQTKQKDMTINKRKTRHRLADKRESPQTISKGDFLIVLRAWLNMST